MDRSARSAQGGAVDIDSALVAPAGAGILAEAVTFDPGVVVGLFVVAVLLFISAIAVVVTGVCAGYRSGRDPGRTNAEAAWRVCLVIELGGVAAATASFEPTLMLATWAALGSAVVARWWGHHERTRTTRERS
jgi:divalent metal cation (Fe/Co/Zn/Cd) transporter